MSHVSSLGIWGLSQEKLYFPREGSKETPPHPSGNFTFKDYMPMAFRKLRQIFAIDAGDYMMSICGVCLPGLPTEDAVQYNSFMCESGAIVADNITSGDHADDAVLGTLPVCAIMAFAFKGDGCCSQAITR